MSNVKMTSYYSFDQQKDLKDRKHHHDAIMTSNCNLPLFHMDGGRADSTCLQIVFFITSFRGAAGPQNLVTFQEYNVE